MASEVPDSKSTNSASAGESQISIRFDARLRSMVKRVFITGDLEKTAAILCQLAFEEWLEWLSGTNRYTSATDQSIDRVAKIYSQVMPDQEPDLGILYNRFNIPYGRARYITQAIVNRQLHLLNASALKRLIQTLENKLAEYIELRPAERKTLQETRFVVDPRAEILLITIVDQMPVDKRPVSTLKRIPGPLPSTREYVVDPKDLEPILDYVKMFQSQQE